MKFINKTGNTVRLPDIELSVPFREDLAGQIIDLDLVKKSRAFRSMVMLGKFKIVEVGNSIFEKNLIKAQDMLKKSESISMKVEDQNTSTDMQVKVRGHFFEAGGYAKVNRNMALGLHNLGVNISIEPYTNANNHLTEEELKQLKPMKKNMGRNSICIDSIIPTFMQGSGGKYNILYTTIEAATIPQQFVDVANSYNEIWVVSDFCKQVLEKYDVRRPIFVFPDTIDSSLYVDKGIKYQFNPSLRKFVFVSLFGWSYRKGYDALLKSYLKAFNGNDDVSLLIISRFQHKKNDIIKTEIKKHIDLFGGNNPAHIARYSNVIPEDVLPSIYRACNSFVLFSRGEGFGIPYAESGLCGLPVIATNHSGHTMFLNKQNSTLVDIDSLETVEDGRMHVHYWDGQEFPSLRSSDFINRAAISLRNVYENYSEAKEKNKNLQSLLQKEYSIDHVASRMRNRLLNIWSKIK